MFKRIADQIMGTSRINPSEYAAQISPNRLKSLGYSLAGWIYMLRRQKNTRLMSLASIAIAILCVWLQIDRVEFAIIIVAITIVWLTEFLNAGIEAAVDLASPDLHPMAQVGKDVASAAVLLGVIASILIGILILGPHLIEKIDPNSPLLPS
ncbi:MAG: diacylglycerol kinase family protein [Anaerolineae bacterium]|nr:diacylglycerol kinase family protein [Anaerolineae bacterium]MCA9887092.1 diacylglycerol kinase family protein [Anaerolineae bacterium]